ncbi:MAG: hypothetical protein ACK6BC_15500, partial [Cyanobacteriota bacterium]
MTSWSRPRQGDLFAGPLPLADPAPAPPGEDPLAARSGNTGPVAEALPFARRQLLEWQERLAAYQAPLWMEADREEGAEGGGGPGEAKQASLFAAAEAPPGLSAPLADPDARARALRPLS